jgi:hypothetical protein
MQAAPADELCVHAQQRRRRALLDRHVHHRHGGKRQNQSIIAVLTPSPFK